MRDALYARTSSNERTVDQQLARLRPLAPGAEEFVDEGYSGSLRSRPAFDHLVAAINGGHVDQVWVVKLDRLGRSTLGVLGFFELCREHDVAVHVVDQAIDTSTPAGRFLLANLSAFAELEREMIIERTKEKLALIREGRIPTRSGRPIGRPRRVTPELVRKIHELRGSGMRWSDVAQRVSLPAGTCRKFPPPPTREMPLAENPSRLRSSAMPAHPRVSEQPDTSDQPP